MINVNGILNLCYARQCQENSPQRDLFVYVIEPKEINELIQCGESFEVKLSLSLSFSLAFD